jgi:hypothetical protein
MSQPIPKMKLAKRKFWIRYVFANKACEETNYFTQTKCRDEISQRLKSDTTVRFAYIMTYDAFGECFHDLIRRGP